MGTISGMILKNLQMKATIKLGANFVTVYMSSTMSGNRFRRNFKLQMVGSSPEFYLRSRECLQPSCSKKNIRGKRKRR